MACCMFAAFIVGHIVLMWRTIMERWFPARAAARAAALTASAWRPGMEMAPAVARPRGGSRLLTRTAGIALIAISVGYFAVQAKDAFERADDAQSFAVLLAQNICRVAPTPAAKPPIQVAAAQSRIPK